MNLKKKNLQDNRIAILITGLPGVKSPGCHLVSALIGIEVDSRLWMEGCAGNNQKIFHELTDYNYQKKIGGLFIFMLNFV